MTDPAGPPPPLELRREETRREDGRYLIYYTFAEAEQPGGCPAQTPDIRPYAEGTAGDVAPALHPDHSGDGGVQAPALQPDHSTQAWNPVLPEGEETPPCPS